MGGARIGPSGFSVGHDAQMLAGKPYRPAGDGGSGWIPARMVGGSSFPYDRRADVLPAVTRYVLRTCRYLLWPHGNQRGA